ncbi:MAG: extracellular solute-binding protein, partial [Mycobacterium sp.]
MTAVLAVAAAAGYASSSSGAAGPHSASAGTASGTTTIEFAESGLGGEGQQTQAAINAFEKANRSIKVKIDVLSPNSTTYLQQLQQRFIAGSSTPDVFESDVTYPAKFAQAGWVKSLTSLHPNMHQFFSTEVAAGTYKGVPYAVPWFDNPEGLFYRT